ncbi:MAG: sulfatase-like hydrolase/transferase, partial [Kiritimatiellia bacterium]
AFYMPSTGDRVPTVLIRNHRVENLDPADPIKVGYKHAFPNEVTGRDNMELATVLKALKGHGHADAITMGVSRIGYMTGGQAALWKDENLSDTLCDEACKFIETNKDKPFALYFATHGIHEPRVPAKRFQGASGAGVYGDQTQELDAGVGRVLETLDRLNLGGNTLVIFSSDNGATDWVGYDYGDGLERAKLNGHRINGVLCGEKGTVWEGGTRVPFIVRWPGRVPAGRESAALVSQVDFTASFAKLTGGALPAGASPDSVDVLDALLGKSEVGRHELVEHKYGPACALRVDNWKLIDGELFDLSNDLPESRNLAREHPDRAAAMASRLQSLRFADHQQPHGVDSPLAGGAAGGRRGRWRRSSSGEAVTGIRVFVLLWP